MKYTVILVNYRSTKLIQDKVSGLRGSPDREVIVVDNSADYPCGNDPAIILRPSENLGFGGGCNLGASRAKHDVLAFVNPDLDITAEQLDLLASTYDQRSIYGPAVLQNGRATNLRRPGRLGLTYERYVLPLEASRNELMSVGFVSGACMMLTKSIFETAGRFPDDIFMYAEDLHICRKASELGVPSRIFSGILVDHVGGGSSQDKRKMSAKLRRLARSWSGHYIFFRKQGSAPIKGAINALHLAAGRVF